MVWANTFKKKFFLIRDNKMNKIVYLNWKFKTKITDIYSAYKPK